MATRAKKKSPAKAAGKSGAARPQKTQQDAMKEIGIWPFNPDMGGWQKSTKEFFPMNNNNNPFAQFASMNPFANMQDKMQMPNMGNAMKSMQECQQIMQGFAEAQMKAANVAQSRWENMMKTCSCKAQNMNERSQAAAKALMGCKNISELTETQSRLVQESLEDMMSTASAMTEMCAKMAMDVAEPLTQQMSSAMGKMKNVA